MFTCGLGSLRWKNSGDVSRAGRLRRLTALDTSPEFFHLRLPRPHLNPARLPLCLPHRTSPEGTGAGGHTQSGPGLVDMAIGSEERMEKGGPLIVVLDSLSSLRYDHESELINLRNYLMCEWNEKKPDRPKYTFSQNEIKFIQPKVPQQPMNSQDCGIYMLHYMELIMNRYLAISIGKPTLQCY